MHPGPLASPYGPNKGLQNMYDSNTDCCVNKLFSQSSKGKGPGFQSVKLRVQTERAIPLQNHPQKKKPFSLNPQGFLHRRTMRYATYRPKEASQLH